MGLDSTLLSSPAFYICGSFCCLFHKLVSEELMVHASGDGFHRWYSYQLSTVLNELDRVTLNSLSVYLAVLGGTKIENHVDIDLRRKGDSVLGYRGALRWLIWVLWGIENHFSRKALTRRNAALTSTYYCFIVVVNKHYIGPYQEKTLHLDCDYTSYWCHSGLSVNHKLASRVHIWHKVKEKAAYLRPYRQNKTLLSRQNKTLLSVVATFPNRKWRLECIYRKTNGHRKVLDVQH